MSHFDQVVALLRGTGFTVHAGRVPDVPQFPYAVLWWPGAPRRSVYNLRGDSGHAETVFQITSVGLTLQSVQIVAQAMQNAVLDAVVEADGWVSHRIKHYGTTVPIQEDRDVIDEATKRHPFYTVDTYRLSAEVDPD